MNFAFSSCGRSVLIRVHGESHCKFIERYYAPGLGAPFSSSDFQLQVTEEKVTVVHGPAISGIEHLPVRAQLEWVLLQLAMFEQDCVLHAGAVVYRGRSIIFLAPSGGGKSSLTRAALIAGASYVTDDILCIRGERMSGVARSLRFKEHREGDPLPGYLAGTTMERTFEGTGLLTPVWWNGAPVELSFPVQLYPSVVAVLERGNSAIQKLEEVERLVALHESAIARHGEYDGRLGPGPGFRLTWEDPDQAFRMLVQELNDSF